MMQLGEFPTEDELKNMVAEVDQVRHSMMALQSISFYVEINLSGCQIKYLYVLIFVLLPGQEWDN